MKHSMRKETESQFEACCLNGNSAFVLPFTYGTSIIGLRTNVHLGTIL